MRNKEKVFAYIDGANLHKGVLSLGWKFDYQRFRIWLKDKYNISNAYLFIGFVSKNKNLYTYLQEAGFILVYKEIMYDGNGLVKGNCDAALVLKATSDFYEKHFNKAVLVSSDGDYAELVDFLKKREAFKMLVSPSNKCSYLLRKQNIPLLYLDTQRGKLEKNSEIKRKSPQ